jgi:hypothetical protein
LHFPHQHKERFTVSESDRCDTERHERGFLVQLAFQEPDYGNRTMAGASKGPTMTRQDFLEAVAQL